MNVSLEKTDDVTGKLIVKIEKADYASNVEKSLKKLKQRAKMPGFRPGMVPMSMIQKMYGTEVKAEEVNKSLTSAVNNYIKEQKLQLLADPLISEEQKDLDMIKGDEFEFIFDLGIAPQIAVELTTDDKLPFYDIEVDDKTVDDQVKNYCRQTGKSEDVEAYEEEDDLMRGTLVELAEDGSEKEGGIKIEKVSLMPKYFSNDAQKELFKGAKKDADIVFNVSKAYEGKDAEIASILKVDKADVANHAGDFKYNVEQVTRFVPGELNQELFDFVCGKDNVKSEEEFRAKVKSDIEQAYTRDSDYKLLIDIRDYAMQKVGDVKFPEAVLKRFLLDNTKKEEDKANIDNLLASYIKELKWSLVRTRLAEANNVKIDEKAMKDTAREMIQIQFAQYGMNNIPEDMLTKYADEMLNNEKQRDSIINRCIDRSLLAAIKPVLTLEHQTKSIADFNKMFETETAE